jgi:LmbE family N-acetylglucosaminyl deacetylase
MSPTCLAGALALFLLAAAPRAQQAEPEAGLVAIHQTLRDLATDVVVLNVAAHPDDESSRTGTILRRKHGMRVVTAYSTYGDGGQNAIGREIGPELAAIRVRETLRAAAMSGVAVRWLGMPDFGFSKTLDETLAVWGKDALLAAMRAQIDAVDPDVIVTNHSLTQGHGHHRATWWAAVEVLKERAAAGRFVPWMFMRCGADDAQLVLDPAELDVARGETYARLAHRAWTQHVSQGPWGPHDPLQVGKDTWKLAFPADADAATVARAVDLAQWGREPRGGAGLPANAASLPAAELLALARERFVAAQRAYDEALQDLATPAARRRAGVLRHRRDALQRLLLAAAGVRVEAWLADRTVAFGRSGKAYVVVHGHEQVRDLAVRCGDAVGEPAQVKVRPTPFDGMGGGAATPATAAGPATDAPAGNGAGAPAVRVPFDVPTSWSEDVAPAAGAARGVPNGATRGAANGADAAAAPAAAAPAADAPALRPAPRPGCFQVAVACAVAADGGDAADDVVASGLVPAVADVDVAFTLDGVPLRVALALDYDPTPPIEVAWDREVAIVRRGAVVERTFHVRVANHSPYLVNDPIALRMGPGIGATSVPGRLSLTADHAEARVLVKARIEADELTASASLGCQFQAASARLPIRVVDVQVPAGMNVLLVRGPDDSTEQALADLGVPYAAPSRDELMGARLEDYTAVLLDIRAGFHRPELAELRDRLQQYCRGGGRVVAMYHKSGEWNEKDGRPSLAPFPLTVGEERVTDENAAVAFLQPAHALLTRPHALGEADFAGWVQERGLNFPKTWDAAWTPLLAMQDPGDKQPHQGALLVTQFGRGDFVYCSLALYRQLRRGHEGALRLLVNLLARG